MTYVKYDDIIKSEIRKGNKKMEKEVMTLAWKIAKRGAKRFGISEKQWA
nr:MAG TPA: hypothetical protein [Caudoviricetes sp.]